MLTQSSKRVEYCIEKCREKETCTGEPLFDNNNAVDIYNTTRLRSLREGPPPNSTTKKDFLGFHVSISRDRVNDKQIIVT